MIGQAHIFIADDDADDVAFLAEAMAQILPMVNISKAGDGGACISMLKNNFIPDVIFLDLDMPKRNGIECLKIIKEMPHLKQTPVIIYSNSHNFREIDKCYKLGADFYIVKPAVLSTMVSLLKELFSYLSKQNKISSLDQFVLMKKSVVNASSFLHFFPGQLSFN